MVKPCGTGNSAEVRNSVDMESPGIHLIDASGGDPASAQS
ncbi:hypothetical protein MXAN_2998 [Myxococcus xanthus DK 1622]|uniref:Uncharacterized protein n=1 Tax=Myxococcus xanthus (strain DK1622) TaxID=246197 RepID=Q1D816_MYXXD|nr:hypothetical protein MXAN_2998 [Myxococcus xanthus DK 1622]